MKAILQLRQQLTHARSGQSLTSSRLRGEREHRLRTILESGQTAGAFFGGQIDARAIFVVALADAEPRQRLP